MKPERQVADLGSKHRSPAMGSTLLFPFQLEEVRRLGSSPSSPFGFLGPEQAAGPWAWPSLAWLPWVRSPQPTTRLSAGDVAAQLAGISAPHS